MSFIKLKPLGCPNCNSDLILKIRNIKVTKKKIKTELCHCKNCDFLFLNNINWLDIAYEENFFGDTGYVARNVNIAGKLIILLRIFSIFSRFKVIPSGMDLGTGIGMLPRMLRDSGYDFYGNDAYSNMELIKPFSNPQGRTFLKTAFEVVEHVPSLPIFLKDNIFKKDTFIFSTLIRPNEAIPDKSWWYYAFENGQHVSFHSKKSLSQAFKMAGYNPKNLISFGSNIHLFSEDKIWKISFKFAKIFWILGNFHKFIHKKLTYLFFREDSLTYIDHVYSIKNQKNI